MAEDDGTTPDAPTGASADPRPGPGQSWEDVEPAPRTTPAGTSLLRSAGSVLGRGITRGLFGTARRRR